MVDVYQRVVGWMGNGSFGPNGVITRNGWWVDLCSE